MISCKWNCRLESLKSIEKSLEITVPLQMKVQCVWKQLKLSNTIYSNWIVLYIEMLIIRLGMISIERQTYHLSVTTSSRFLEDYPHKYQGFYCWLKEILLEYIWFTWLIFYAVIIVWANGNGSSQFNFSLDKVKYDLSPLIF